MDKVIIPVKIFFLLILLPTALLAKSETAVSDDQQIYIKIDDVEISRQEFSEVFAAAARSKYYHGAVPEEELDRFRQQVAEDIVVQQLVYREATRLGMKPDSDKIREGIERYDTRYQHHPQWQAQKNQLIPLMTQRLERLDLFEQLEQQVKTIPEPEQTRVIDYYRDNPDKFTEPRQFGLSVILLSVPPSSAGEMWQQAVQAAEQLRFRIINGESFEDIARELSGHASAVNGGDLGYVHQGMLETSVQKAVEQLETNQITPPITVLEGVALFRLNSIRQENLRPFQDVEQRAMKLLQRELQEQAWNSYVDKLKSSADIYINKKLYVQNDHE